MIGRGMTGPGTPALFLDRDGVINHDLGYVHRSADFRFMDGIFALCETARGAGMAVHVVTNQAGIGRGYYSEADFLALSDWMRAEFTAQGVALDGVHYCPFHPEHGIGDYRRESPRRKPAPGMLLDAAATHGLDLSRSVIVGDKASDMQAGYAAGVQTLILLSGDATEVAACPPGTHVVAKLDEARCILAAPRNGL